MIDTGIGIRPEEIEPALKPFEQTSSATHANENGTGLGLPITKLLVEQHGGTLTLQSAAGEGTRVTLQFPKNLETRNTDKIVIPAPRRLDVRCVK